VSFGKIERILRRRASRDGAGLGSLPAKLDLLVKYGGASATGESPESDAERGCRSGRPWGRRGVGRRGMRSESNGMLGRKTAVGHHVIQCGCVSARAVAASVARANSAPLVVFFLVGALHVRRRPCPERENSPLRPANTHRTVVQSGRFVCESEKSFLLARTATGRSITPSSVDGPTKVSSWQRATPQIEAHCSGLCTLPNRAGLPSR